MSKIDRLRLSFKAEQFDGHALLRECSQLFHQRVLADLDQLIHRLATRTSRPRLIKRLVIDLGVLDASGWKEQWRTRLLQRLEQALIEELARAEQNRANEDSMTPHDESEAWMHWLHTGVGTASAAPSLSAMNMQAHPAMPAAPVTQLTESAMRTVRTRLQQWLQMNPVLRSAVRRRLAQLCAIPALQDIWAAYEAQHPEQAKLDSLTRAAQGIPLTPYSPDAIAESIRPASDAVSAQQDAIWPDASEHAPDMPYRMNPAIVPNELAGLSAGFGLLWPLLPGVLRALERNKPAADTDDALLWTALESFQSYPVMPTSSAMQVTEKAIHTARTRLQQWLQANPVLRPAVRHRLAQLCAIPALKDIWAAYEAQHPEPAKADSLARAAQDISSATRLPDAIAGSNRPAPEAVSAQRTVRPDAPVLPDTPDRINRSRDRNAAFIPSEFAVLSAGLVLLWPMLPGLFRTLALLDDANHFIDASAPLIAAGWLDELAWGDDTVAEWRTPVNKLLCGVALDAMLPDWQPDPTVRAQLNGWLAALPSRLPGLHRCSVTDVRQLFLQRPGMLTRQPNKRWTLQVEPHAADVLLHMIPWPLEQVWLPWCNDLLCVEWRR